MNKDNRKKHLYQFCLQLRKFGCNHIKIEIAEKFPFSKGNFNQDFIKFEIEGIKMKLYFNNDCSIFHADIIDKTFWKFRNYKDIKVLISDIKNSKDFKKIKCSEILEGFWFE